MFNVSREITKKALLAAATKEVFLNVPEDKNQRLQQASHVIVAKITFVLLVYSKDVCRKNVGG